MTDLVLTCLFEASITCNKSQTMDTLRPIEENLSQKSIDSLDIDFISNGDRYAGGLIFHLGISSHNATHKM